MTRFVRLPPANSGTKGLGSKNARIDVIFPNLTSKTSAIGAVPLSVDVTMSYTMIIGKKLARADFFNNRPETVYSLDQVVGPLKCIKRSFEVEIVGK
jgi:hypothetical protein